jgi:indolepyruvate ferredoxin oxidoreductase beta subunit
MKYDVILAGVGGQGVLSIANIIAQAAASSGLQVRQGEVHGMSQRGGAVLAHLRLADTPIACDLVPRGGADLIISMEAMESLRYAEWLHPEGAVAASKQMIQNIPNYPALETIEAAAKVYPKLRFIDAESLAREAGLPRAVNMVMTGAASVWLPLEASALEGAIASAFSRKGQEVVEANLRAFRLGQK